MKFRRLHVNGFGIWQDLDLPDLSPGLNVLVAPNEGGKSTLMAFIRAVLFGFKRRGDPRRYEPLRGGAHGGFIDVEGVDGAFRLARTAGSSSRGDVEITADDGSPFDEEKLENLVHHTTETLYENVFAFGLDELQRLDTLQAEDVAGHIYSAGMGAGELSPVAFRQRMRDAHEALYLKRGKKQPITALLQEIESDEDRVQQLRELPEEHADLVRQHERMRVRLAEHGERLRREQRALESLLRAERAWPHFEQLLEAETTLETIGVSQEKMRAVATAQAGAAADDGDGGGKGVTTRIASVIVGGLEGAHPVDLMSSKQQQLLEHANRIRGLLTAAERLRSLRDTVVERQQESRAMRHELFNDLEQLGGEWSLERVRSVRTDVKARDDVRQWSDRLHVSESEIESSASRAADANLVYEAVREGRDQINRGTLIVAWALILGAIAATATFVPAPARLISTTSIVTVGMLLGALVTWLHSRGQSERRSEQAVAARREAELWQHHEQAKELLQRTRRDWQHWLKERRLPTDLSVQGALDLLERLKLTQTKDQRAADAEATVDAVGAELQQACMDILAALEEIDRQAMDLRYDTLKMVDPLLGTIDALQTELGDVEEHRERIRGVLEQHSRGRAGLRALTGEEGLADLLVRLEKTDPDRLRGMIGEGQACVADARSDRDAVNESLGALRQRIEDLETGRELSELLVAREGRRAELAERVHDWCAYALTAALYDEAKRKYEAERQPQVLRLASRYFEMMTDGRYSRVIAPLGENRLEVERRDTGERLQPFALSRGTGEQLYLAMRLALAKVYGQQAVPLPLVADDILVNFDDDRARATAALLEVYAEEGHQILAFTCHRHLVDTFERFAPTAQVTTLPAHA